MHNHSYLLPQFGIGVDIESIGRFREVGVIGNSKFLKKVFTRGEMEYCFSMESPEQHLAARFAGKEAIIKALASLNRANLGYGDIEIINNPAGVPIASIRKAGFDDLQVKLSLSHSQDEALAFTVVIQKPLPD